MKMSFLRWAGSKKKLLNRLLPYWQASGCQRYVEPFAGSAMLYFAAQPRQALLADTNEDLIAMYRTIQRNWQGVFRVASQYPCTEQYYYQLRDTKIPQAHSYRRAARFIYLNRFCFNGLYRTNCQGEFNVPYARGTTRRLQSRDEFEQFSHDIQNAQFVCQDFRDTLQQVRRGDFVYIDPPYAIENRRIFKQYGPTTFGTDDLRDLSDLLVNIDGRGARFVVSYAYNNDSIEILEGWHRRFAIVARTVSGDASCRSKVKELFVSNMEM